MTTAVGVPLIMPFSSLLQHNGDWITSILSFDVSNVSAFGRYSLLVQNEIGREIKHITIDQSKRGAGAFFCCPQTIAKTQRRPVASDVQTMPDWVRKSPIRV